MAKINIATFNIRNDNLLDGWNAWMFRRAWVREIIDRNKLDIVGIQEAKANQVDYLAAGRLDFVGVGRDDGKRGGEFAPIFYDRRRFQHLRSGTFWLSETPDVVSRGWDAGHNRVCTWVSLKDRSSGGPPFFVFNTHLDNKGAVARERSVALILQRIRSIAGATPFFLIGDFNLRPQTPPIRLLSSTLRNSRLVTETKPAGPDGTANGFDVNRPLTTRIDYIFASPTVRVLSYAVLKEIRNGRYASDHLPVVVSAFIEKKPVLAPGKSSKTLPRR
ncbi:MAG: endonuclease/exonuclease/phosphatase family protein [Armatimonadota bacterium]